MRDIVFLGEGLSFGGIAAPDGVKCCVRDGGEAFSEAGCGAAGADDAEADQLRFICYLRALAGSHRYRLTLLKWLGIGVAWVGRLRMKSWGAVGLIAGMVWLGVGLAMGQEAAPTVVRTTQPPARVYDIGVDVVAPQLLPMQWPVIAPDTCKEPKEGLVSLVLEVDADGVSRNVSVAGAQGTTLEKMALHIVNMDRFKPGTLKDEPVAVKWMAEVTVKGCFATKTDDAGNTSGVFRLTAQPVQEFGATARQKESAEIASAIAGVTPEPGLSKVGNAVFPPAALNHVEARYSDEARIKHIEGVCLISVIVDAQGMPQNARVIRSLGYGLDEKAIEAVKKYKFKPAMKDGKTPVPVMITVQVNFRLYERPN